MRTVPRKRLPPASRFRNLPHSEDGQSLVEIALSLPLMLLVVTGIMAFGVAFNNYIMLTEATAVGARLLSASRGQTLDPCQTFSNAVYAAAPMLKQSSIVFSISLNGTTYNGTTCSGTASSGAPANMILGSNAIVTATYPFGINVYGMTIVQAGSLLVAKTTEMMQ